MGGRRRLSAGMPRVFGRHDGRDGQTFRRAWAALLAEPGLAEAIRARPLVRLEAARTASAWVVYSAAVQAWAASRRAREQGRGRRPSPQSLERLARRVGLAESSYAVDLDKLRALAGQPRGPSLADYMHEKYGSRDG